MLKQSTCTAYVNVQQKVHRTARLSQTADKQIRTSLAPLPFPCTTAVTAESTSYLVNEDAVGQGLPTCTTRRVCRVVTEIGGRFHNFELSTGQLNTSTYFTAAFFFLFMYYFSRSLKWGRPIL